MKSPTSKIRTALTSAQPQQALVALVPERVRFALRHHFPTDTTVNSIVKALEEKHPQAYLLQPTPFGVLVRKVYGEIVAAMPD